MGPAVGVAVGIVVGGAILFCHCFVFVVSFPCCLFIFFFCFVAGGRRSVRSVRLLLRVSTSLPQIAIGDKV